VGVVGLEGLVSAPENHALRETADALVEAGGRGQAAILLYGSHVQNSAPDQYSAYDFMVVTDAYLPFYRRLHAGGHHGKPAWILTALSHVLPPNVISFRYGPSGGRPAKCAVVSPRHLRRSLGPRSLDHFLKGRVVQKLSLLWCRSPEDQEMILSALRMAREGIVAWVRPFLARDFTVEEFAETMLRVSYRGEIRPENPGRVLQVFQSQESTLLAIAEESLTSAEARGDVFRDGTRYEWSHRPGPHLRMVYSTYFVLSKARATARWFKYMVTFEGWLDYINRKIQRRAGFEVEVTERERRWPLIFLWPKLFQVLRAVKSADAVPPPGDEEEAI